jgi:hypothetical protein
VEAARCRCAPGRRTVSISLALSFSDKRSMPRGVFIPEIS